MQVTRYVDGSVRARLMTNPTSQDLQHLQDVAARDILDPTVASVTLAKRVGPNAKCPCGSGKKFKRCCEFKGFHQ